MSLPGIYVNYPENQLTLAVISLFAKTQQSRFSYFVLDSLNWINELNSTSSVAYLGRGGEGVGTTRQIAYENTNTRLHIKFILY